MNADMLFFHNSADHTNWDALLPYITLEYNTTVQSTTYYATLRLLFGQQALSTFYILFLHVPISEILTHAKATCRSEECRKLARYCTFDSQVSVKLKYDDLHRHVSHFECDVV